MTNRQSLMSWLSFLATFINEGDGWGSEGGGGGVSPHRFSPNELSWSISLASGKGKTRDGMTGRANQLEVIESGNSLFIGLGSPTWRNTGSATKNQKSRPERKGVFFIGFKLIFHLGSDFFQMDIIDCRCFFLLHETKRGLEDLCVDFNPGASASHITLR